MVELLSAREPKSPAAPGGDDPSDWPAEVCAGGFRDAACEDPQMVNSEYLSASTDAAGSSCACKNHGLLSNLEEFPKDDPLSCAPPWVLPLRVLWPLPLL